MALTEQIESVIEFLWKEALITNQEKTTLKRKLALCSRSISTELDDTKVINFFDAPTVQEMIIREAIKEKAYRLSANDFHSWLNHYLNNGFGRET